MRSENICHSLKSFDVFLYANSNMYKSVEFPTIIITIVVFYRFIISLLFFVYIPEYEGDLEFGFENYLLLYMLYIP